MSRVLQVTTLCNYQEKGELNGCSCKHSISELAQLGIPDLEKADRDSSI